MNAGPTIDFWNYATDATPAQLKAALRKVRDDGLVLTFENPLRQLEIREVSVPRPKGKPAKGIYGFLRRVHLEDLPRKGKLKEDDEPLDLGDGYGLCSRGFFYLNFEPKVVAWLGKRNVGGIGVLTDFFAQTDVDFKPALKVTEAAWKRLQDNSVNVRRITLKVSGPKPTQKKLGSLAAAMEEMRSEINGHFATIVIGGEPYAREYAMSSKVVSWLKRMDEELELKSASVEFLREASLDPVELIEQRVCHHATLPTSLNEVTPNVAWQELRNAFRVRVGN